MLKKETAYNIFRVIWVYLLISNIADLRLHTDIDLLPFIHLSEIPFIKYAPFVLAAFLLIPFNVMWNALNRKYIRSILILTAVLILISLVSSFYSAFPETGLRTTSRFFFYYVLLIAAITAAYYFEGASDFMIKSLVYINVFVIAGSLLDYYVPAFHNLLVAHFDRPETKHSVLRIGDEVFMRPMGFLTDTNLTAFSIGLAMLLLLLNHKHFNRVFIYVFFAAGSYASGMLASRASFIMCFAAAVIFAFTKQVELKKVIMFVVIFLVFQAATPQIYSRYLTFSDEKKIGEEAKFGRLVIWKAAIDLFEENPVIGAGPGNFFEHSQIYMRRVIFRENPHINIDDPDSPDYYTAGKGNPHNLFLVVISETGIAGFMIFISILSIIFIYYKKKRYYMSLLFFLLVLMVSSLSNFAPYYKFYLLTCIILFAVSAQNMKITPKSAV